jgi:hypothetical protein
VRHRAQLVDVSDVQQVAWLPMSGPDLDQQIGSTGEQAPIVGMLGQEGIDIGCSLGAAIPKPSCADSWPG